MGGGCIRGYTGVQVYRRTGVQVYRCTGVQVYRCTGVQVPKCVHKPQHLYITNITGRGACMRLCLRPQKRWGSRLCQFSSKCSEFKEQFKVIGK